MKSLASRTQLPPSPELGALSSLGPPDPLPLPFSVLPPTATTTITTTTLPPPPRLRSVARYTTYRPTALTTSDYLPALQTSLGAVAAVHGLALFRCNEPTTPVSLLHCHHPTTTTTTTTTTAAAAAAATRTRTTHMAFGPSATTLAATRGGGGGGRRSAGSSSSGEGIMIWPVHRSMTGPMARVQAPPDNSSNGSGMVTNLAWRDGHTLAACTANVACVWDLRQSNAGGVKPTLRFGTRRTMTTNNNNTTTTTNTAAAPYVQMALSQQEESLSSCSTQVALLDATGTLRIWDWRYMTTDISTLSSTTTTTTIMDNHPHHNTNCVVIQPHALQAVGVGVAAAAHNSWVVWGYDRVHEPAVAKLWGPHYSSSNNNNNSSMIQEDSLTATTTLRQQDGEISSSLSSSSSLCLWETLAAPDGLACARVCQEHIVTLSIGNNNNAEATSTTTTLPWHANVYKIRQPGKVEPVVSFGSSPATQPFGTVCATSAALSTFGPTSIEQGQAHFPHRTSGLLLVNLTQEGYVTTHSIPEAMESLPLTEKTEVKTITDRGTNNRRSLDAPPSGPVPAISTKIIPDDRDLGDVARAWSGSNREGSDEQHRADDSNSVLPFDTDVPVAYSIPSSDVQQALRRNTGAAGTVVGESVPTAATTVSQDSGEIVSPTVRVQVDTRRIPCPRLCGASFGPGGLAIFANGQVQRMWAWYTSSAAASLAHHQGRPDEDFSGRRALAPGEKRGLRTMNDLQNMMKAAKNAQWGEHSEDDASSVTSQQLGLGFFEDGDSDDDESTDSVVADDSEDLAELGDDKHKGMYETYFGDFRRPLTKANSRLGSSRPGSNDGDSIGGPSSDMLSPVVKITRAFDKTAMHHQSRELALKWKLGDFPYDLLNEIQGGDEGDLGESNPAMNESYSSIPSSLSPSRLLFSGTRLTGDTRKQLSGILLPTQSDRLISPPKQPRAKSQPNIIANAYDVDETGVHGGEYSVRPHMKESMVFLKKLVNYQQDSGSALAGSSGHRGLMSPPDGPMQARTRTARPIIPHSPTKKQGAYVLRQTKPTNSGSLEAIKSACEYNAMSSREMGETEKAETWKLLAQVVTGRLNAATGGRWKPRASMAVGCNLVSLVLQYYEKKGDVQMLATIVCVLRQEKKDSEEDMPLLSGESDIKYDSYLRRYSDLLYRWGLLFLRAQINKRLVYSYESREVFGVVSTKGHQVGGITIFSECPHCHQKNTTNYCHNCSDYAFRCTICDMAVRGLFTICNECGHGGHVGHLHEWFKTHKVCPTGCGCRCVIGVPQTD